MVFTQAPLKHIHEETENPSPIKPIFPTYDNNPAFGDYLPPINEYYKFSLKIVNEIY